MGDNLITMFEQGGSIFYVIIGLSVLALGLVIERLIALWRGGVKDDVFFQEFEHLLKQGAEAEDLLQFCQQDDSTLADLFRHGVENASLGFLALRRVLLDYFNDEVKPRLEHNLNWLATIGKMAPMLGLFGTVYGMMGAFSTMAQAATQAKPQELAGDINIALSTTVGGLFVALVVIAFHSVLAARARKRQRDYQKKLGRVLRRLTELEPIRG